MKEALKRIGLTEGETAVYQALIEMGLSSTGKITKHAGIASSKVYEVLQRLMQKGLASYVVKKGVRHYDATPPEYLIDFLEEKKQELTKSQNEIKKIIPEIQLKRKSAEEKNQTVVYLGKEGPKIVLNEILEAGKKRIPNYGFGTDVDPYVVHMPYVLNRYIQEAKKYEFKTYLLFAEGFSSPNDAAEIRYLPKEFLFPVRTMIYGSKVAIVDFTLPITTIIIEKKEIANAYAAHFKMLCKIARRKIPKEKSEL